MRRELLLARNFPNTFIYAMKQIASSLIFLITLAILTEAWAAKPRERVENFTLLDHRGESHELYYYSDTAALVIMVQGNGCPISRNAWPRFKELSHEYAQKRVKFMMINSNLQDHRTSISREAEQFEINLPILVDDTQIIGESLGLIRTGEVFVLNPKDWTVVYRGAMDDRLTYEVQKAVASQHYLKDALDDFLEGVPVRTASTDAVGCLINFPRMRQQQSSEKISYSKEIAPILINKCVICHRSGGIGPWAMTDYSMVRGFAPMIREVIRTKRMPPWHADPAFGHFSNDRSLTVEEVQTLVHWVESGAPRGEGADPLSKMDHNRPQWKLGEPDLVIEIPATEVPATGLVEYQYQLAENPLDEHVWIWASEIIPGDPSALHHVVTKFGAIEVAGTGGEKIEQGVAEQLGVYLPGRWEDVCSQDSAVLLPSGATFEFEMHYTTYGRKTVDRSRFGLYFRKNPPKHHLQVAFFVNKDIKIPPHAKNHKETAEQVFTWGDVLIFDLHPHAHYRGKASNFVAYYPNGTAETLLSVPDYDFNWQTSYKLAEPKLLPKGTRVVHTTWWDNSAQNPANPDPTREVPWGLQSMDEMLYGTIRFSYIDSTYSP